MNRDAPTPGGMPRQGSGTERHSADRNRESVPHQGKRHYRTGCDEHGRPELEIFTPAEAAALLKVPESWLRKRASARQVPCTFIGKHLRFSSSDLEQIIRDGHRDPVTGPSRARRTTT
ncbi:helix-turn-helix domain-containing protein [Nocardiopsis deserti]|uniref:helix-turn-helix domain-containing protein n=1 Tax=Nocardiopsis deserti TaxID=2605988 RepID=UPI001CC251FF|nr:helix-turn-helix domain-containing protein [Nocardiopsis deserti]